MFLEKKKVLISSRGLGIDAIFSKSTQSGSRAGIWLNPRLGLSAPRRRYAEDYEELSLSYEDVTFIN